MNEEEFLDKEKLYFVYGLPYIKWILYKEIIKSIFGNSCVKVNAPQIDELGEGEDDCAFVVWGLNTCIPLQRLIKKKKCQIYRIEDGFIRGIGSNSAMGRKKSLIIEKDNLHYGNLGTSHFERALSNTEYTDQMRCRANELIGKIRNFGILKYNFPLSRKVREYKSRKIKILIPLQIDSGWSISVSGNRYNSSDLPEIVRERSPDSYIILKTPPDFSAEQVRNVRSKYRNVVDYIESELDLDVVLHQVDEVVTVSSTTGFEALIRGKRVVVYGEPFFAGWGLTTDNHVVKNRGRKLELSELVYTSLIDYPYYYSYGKKKQSEVEPIIEEILNEKERIESSKVKRNYFYMKRNLILNSGVYRE